MVRGYLSGHPDAPLLGPPQQLHRSRGGHVADVQRRAGVPGEQAVPRDNRLLRGNRPPGQAQPGGETALVRLRAGGEPRILGMLGDHTSQPAGVLQGPAHQQ